MAKLLKAYPITSTKNNYIILEAYISDICNYSCYYCYNKKPYSKKQLNLNFLLNFIYKVINIFPNKKIFLSLIGGEPTTNPLLEYFIFQLKKYKNITIQIFTNFSKSIIFYKRLLEINNNLILRCTCHSHQIDNIDFFKEKIFKLNKYFSYDRLKITLMYEDKFKTKSIYNLNILKQVTSNILGQIVLKNNNYIPYYDKKDLDYFLQVIDNLNCDKNMSVNFVFDDGTSQMFTDYEISSNPKLMNFKYFRCEAGNKACFIDINGNIWPCQVLANNINYKPFGNIINIDNIKFHDTICLADSCQCLPEMKKSRIFKCNINS